MTESSGTRCRRGACPAPAVGRGLCRHHWGRWYEGDDPLAMPDDRTAAPAPARWVPPRPSWLPGADRTVY
ncbi:hypothetical protein CFN78_18645 [Amycolatopsis antarctica]|uniref:Uncharacterized protein n=2 Tax=Amycolatopsis antarctica TaxID=1854586 RepID=A0A263D2J9_9PSEU|nr:hypothetical protein CFN78_18645 [Amycolatopsis antarctica]